MSPDSRKSGRRSPTQSELQAWRAFIETSEKVKNLVAVRLQQDSGLSNGDYTVLLALSEYPENRIRSSQLADHIGWERSRLSHHLGRMEHRGLVRREAVSGDSRGAEVVLTATGAQLFRSGSAPHLHAVQEIFVRGLSASQIAAVEDAMRSLSAHLNDGTL